MPDIIKTAAELRQEERDKIMEANRPTLPVVTDEPIINNEGETDKTDIEVKNDKVEGEIEKTEDDIEKSEKTEEELNQEKLEAKTAREKEKVQRKIDKEVSKRKAAEDRVAELERQLAAKPDDEKVLTEEDVERLSEQKAEQKSLIRQFTNDCNKLQKDAIKIDKNFDTKVLAMAEDIGQIPVHMVGILADLDNGGEVLNYLTDNTDVAEDIYELSPTKMAMRLAKLSTQIENEKKAKPKPISKVPSPPEPVKGNTGTVETLRPNMSMDDFVRLRNKQEEEKRRKRFG